MSISIKKNDKDRPNELRKEIKRLTASRDSWKAKNHERYHICQILKSRIAEITENRDSWRNKCKEIENKLTHTIQLHSASCESLGLEREKYKRQQEELEEIKKKSKNINEDDLTIRVKKYQYPILLIITVLKMVIDISISFRAVPGALKTIFMNFKCFHTMSVPCFSTVRRWLIQVGHYKLLRAKEKASDWFYIIDNSIQVGCQKVCIIIGVRLSKIKLGVALTLADMEPLELIISSKITPELIASAIKNAAAKTGTPVGLCSDEGGDVLPGEKKYIADHSGVIHIPDIAHKVANLLKKMLQNDPIWDEFLKNITKSKNRTKQSKIAYLSAPHLRGKQRFLNIEIGIIWANKILIFLDGNAKNDENAQEIEEKLGWIKQYRNNLLEYTELLRVAQIAKQLVRTRGIHISVSMEFQLMTNDIQSTDRVRKFIEEISAFLAIQGDKLSISQIAIGSSEILESLFGKLKRLEGDHVEGGFSSIVLGVLACLGTIDKQTVAHALDSSRNKNVQEWIQQNMGVTFLKQRRAALPSLCMEKLGIKLAGVLSGVQIAA
jgi:hypothetical protein